MQQQESKQMNEKTVSELEGMVSEGQKDLALDIENTKSALEAILVGGSYENSFKQKTLKLLDDLVGTNYAVSKDQRDLQREVSFLDRKMKVHQKDIQLYEKAHEQRENSLQNVSAHAAKMTRELHKTQKTIEDYQRLKPSFEPYLQSLSKEKKKSAKKVFHKQDMKAKLAEAKLPMHEKMAAEAQHAYKLLEANVVKSEQMLLCAENALVNMQATQQSLQWALEAKKYAVDEQGQLEKDISIYKAMDSFKTFQDAQESLKSDRNAAASEGVASLFGALADRTYSSL